MKDVSPIDWYYNAVAKTELVLIDPDVQ